MRAHLTSRTRLAVVAGRAAGWLSRVTGRGAGATISGRVMNAIAPNGLAELAAGRTVALVSATNGKTTTTKLLATILASAGHRVVSNSTGANLTSGIAPALAAAPGRGTIVLEVDERVVPRVVDPLGTDVLILGNLSRDQLDRYGEVHSVGASWRSVCESHAELTVVANASDPHVAWAAQPARTTWVALGAPWRQDAATCPACGALLGWSSEGFACAACGFSQPATPHRLDGDTLTLDHRVIPLRLALPGRWNVANAALAVTAAWAAFGEDPERAAAAVSGVTSVAGRYRTVALPDGRPLRIMLAKNPAGWTEVLEWVRDRRAGVVIAVNAHIADGRDPSWLWDVAYERLAGLPVAAAGERHLDVAVRLRYAGVDHVIEPDPIRAAARLAGDEVVVIGSYTQFSALFRTFGS